MGGGIAIFDIKKVRVPVCITYRKALLPGTGICTGMLGGFYGVLRCRSTYKHQVPVFQRMCR